MVHKEPKHWPRCPYNVDPVSSPVSASFTELKSNLHEMQGGSFIVQTNSYYTVSRVTNEKGLNLTAGDGAERQFRMKLPEKSICAFLAIGCRFVDMRLYFLWDILRALRYPSCGHFCRNLRDRRNRHTNDKIDNFRQVLTNRLD